MGIVGTVINTFVVLAVGSFLTWVTIDRSRQLRRELEAKIAEQATATTRLEARMDARLGGLEARLDAGLVAVRSEINAVRSDLTAVALAVGARPSTTSPGTGQP